MPLASARSSNQESVQQDLVPRAEEQKEGGEEEAKDLESVPVPQREQVPDAGQE